MRYDPFCTRTRKRHRARTRLPLALLLLLSCFPRTGAAGTSTGVAFDGIQSTLAIGLGIPHATALDAAGNLYVTDLIDSKVLRITRGSTSLNCTAPSDCTSIGSGFVQPAGVAADAGGNIYVTDAGTQCLYKISPAGIQTIVASGLPVPAGVAIAADGTAFVAVSGAILRVTGAGLVSTFAAGATQPGGLALNAAGTLYLADRGGDQVLQFSPGGLQTTFASGLNAPQAITLDGAGTLYVADTGNNRILSLPAAGTGYVCPIGCNVLAIQTASPGGISSDVSGNLYVADTGNQQVVKLAQDADFGSSSVVATNATPAASHTLNYRLYSFSCASPPTVSVLTRGAIGKDFTSSPAATVCTPGTPDALAVTIDFAPLSPGLRKGSVQFVDAAGTVEVGTYLHGFGVGPEITWTPGVVAGTVTGAVTGPVSSAIPSAPPTP